MLLVLLPLRLVGYSQNQAYLTEMIQEFQRNGIRTSIFVSLDMIEGAKKTGTDRIELYGGFCASIRSGQSKAIEPYIAAAVLAND
jgi:pyridoxine 5-phosphate synthase